MDSSNKTPSLDPAILVIFGITGDLSQRKLLPAIYHLIKDNLLHDHTVIMGLTRRSLDVNELLSNVELCISEIDGICDPAVVAKLKSRLRILQLDISESEAYPHLLDELNKIEEEHKLCMNRLFYLAIPPQVTDTIINNLGKYGLHEGCQHKIGVSRLLIEKPFGYDLRSAQELIETISKYFKEEQIFRIDHYLAKETVQNILTFRYNNAFEKLWNKEHISHILITAAETIGVEGRATFYEQVGALRDIIQSHLLQLLALVTLDLPPSLSSGEIHRAKLDLLKEIIPILPKSVNEVAIKGQYKGYREEIGNPHSTTETFAAVKLSIGNNRWNKMPIFMRTGKKLAEKVTEIRVVFEPLHAKAPPNILVFRLQPNEGIELDLQVKKPGFDYEMQTASMDFSYQATFNVGDHPDAYERVLVDAVRGDHTLFATSDEVLAAWRVIEAVVEMWSKNGEGLEEYEPGSWGPEAQNKLLEELNSNWNGIELS